MIRQLWARAPRFTALLDALIQYRRPVIILSHLGMVALCNYLAFSLRFDADIPQPVLGLYFTTLPVLLLLRFLALHRSHLFGGMWRYTGLWDLRDLAVATILSSLAFFAIVEWVLGISGYPRSVYLIDALLVMFFLGGTRLVTRVFRHLAVDQNARRILIIGAGDAGAMIAREMKSNVYYSGRPVGFVDDDRRKRGQFIHGVRVYGGRTELPRIIDATRPDEVLIAMPRVPSSTVREVLASLQPFDLPIKTLPNLSELIGGQVSLREIRPLAIEDLLQRPPIGLDSADVRQFLQGRRVLVTGAGGSIGSELCRQIAEFQPACLIPLDRYENGLYAVLQDLGRRTPELACAPLVADVADRARMEAIFCEHRPDVIFHAAAHKHVPLMEASPSEAVKNNVTATRVLAELAAAHGAARFVLISTDKAVNPTSVMGATKRVAERIIQSLMPECDTVFTAVRFGNVLGSNGSVVPLFTQQIKAGGPVTVTHPEIRRYFMLIPEAVQLVLHAASLAHGGAVFVLDMGEQIKIVDLARNLIRLSGLQPERDIRIEFVGLRPGEKLYEELVAAAEDVEPTGREKIRRIRSVPGGDRELFAELVRQLEAAAGRADQAATLELLRAAVPTFLPSPGLVGEGNGITHPEPERSGVQRDGSQRG